MALSTQKSYTGPAWALGFVKVTTIGTPVNIMSGIDANNTNAPGTASNNATTEYSRACRAIAFQGYQPGSGNNGMIPNNGNIYILVAPAGSGSGNRTDSGSMLKVLPPGGDYVLSAITPGVDMFSPYSIYLDGDNNNDGALVTIYGGGNP
jgi:hypothetical protein